MGSNYMNITNEDWIEFRNNATKYLEQHSQYATRKAVQDAIDKQIAIKPKEVMGLYNCTYYACPVCGNDGLCGNYCDECGQRIDMD